MPSIGYSALSALTGGRERPFLGAAVHLWTASGTPPYGAPCDDCGKPINRGDMYTTDRREGPLNPRATADSREAPDGCHYTYITEKDAGISDNQRQLWVCIGPGPCKHRRSPKQREMAR